MIAAGVPRDVVAVRMAQDGVIVEPQLLDTQVGRFFVTALPDEGEWELTAFGPGGAVWVSGTTSVMPNGTTGTTMIP